MIVRWYIISALFINACSFLWNIIVTGYQMKVVYRKNGNLNANKSMFNIWNINKSTLFFCKSKMKRLSDASEKVNHNGTTHLPFPQVYYILTGSIL